jgi:hypothetical protein
VEYQIQRCPDAQLVPGKRTPKFRRNVLYHRKYEYIRCLLSSTACKKWHLSRMFRYLKNKSLTYLKTECNPKPLHITISAKIFKLLHIKFQRSCLQKRTWDSKWSYTNKPICSTLPFPTWPCWKMKLYLHQFFPDTEPRLEVWTLVLSDRSQLSYFKMFSRKNKQSI